MIKARMLEARFSIKKRVELINNLYYRPVYDKKGILDFYMPRYWFEKIQLIKFMGAK